MFADNVEKTVVDKMVFPREGKEELQWDFELNLIGEKVDNANIHHCEKCMLPIITYGRLKKCKHSFCLDCAKKVEGKCPRCGEENQEIECGEMGSVYICSYGTSRHGFSGCRRSYLSHRDLQAHIKYRHEGGQEALAAQRAKEGKTKGHEQGQQGKLGSFHDMPPGPGMMTAPFPGGMMGPRDVMQRPSFPPGPFDPRMPPPPQAHFPPFPPQGPGPMPPLGQMPPQGQPPWAGGPRPPFY